MDQGQTTRPVGTQSQTTHDPAYRPENAAGRTADSPASSGATGHDTRPTSSTQNLISPSDAFTAPPPPPPARSRDSQVRVTSRRSTITPNAGLPAHPQNVSDLDHIVPVEEKTHHHHHVVRHTIKERLKQTIQHVRDEKIKYARQALWTKWALNIAIALQVTLGALTTGVAAAIKSAKQAQVSTAILGGLATLVAAYLARVRGSGEPELSITRVKDLDAFLRECEAFDLDHGHEYGTGRDDLDRYLEHLRGRFEELLGNGDGQRKLSSVGITVTTGAATANAATGATTANVTNKSAV